MLRIALAATAAVCTLGLIGAPAATADPINKTRSGHENIQVAPKASASGPKLRTPIQNKLAGHPAGDWRAAKKRTMDRYFEQRREQTIRNINDWLNRH